MKRIRLLLPLVLLILSACGTNTPPELAPPPNPDSPYTPPDSVTDVPNSPYVGDWAWSTTLDGETFFTQGILSIVRFDNTGYGFGSYATCEDTCPAKAQNSGLLNIPADSDIVSIGLYDEFGSETYPRFSGFSFNGLQKDSQGRNAFQGQGTVELCVSTCTKADVNFIVTQTSTVPTYPASN